MTLKPDLASIKAELLSRLPLTEEQRQQFDELLPHARSVASNLLVKWKRHQWLDKDDLYQQAAIHLEEAIREFDPNKSPDIKGWVGKCVSWRLRTWLRKEQRQHEGHKPLVRRERKKTATELDNFLAPNDKQPRRKAPRDVRLSGSSGMTAGTWDRAGSYRDNPLHRIVADEIAVAVRRYFDPRDVAIYCESLMDGTSEDLARKHYVSRERINQIRRTIRDYIREQADDAGILRKLVSNALLYYHEEGVKEAMRRLGFTEEEIRAKTEKVISPNALFGDYKSVSGEEPYREKIR